MKNIITWILNTLKKLWHVLITYSCIMFLRKLVWCPTSLCLCRPSHAVVVYTPDTHTSIQKKRTINPKQLLPSKHFYSYGRHMASTHMQDFRFSQWYWWRFRSSEMLWPTNWYWITDILSSIEFHLQGIAVQETSVPGSLYSKEGGSMLLPKVGNLLPVDTALHPKRLESSSIHISKDKHCLFSHQDPMQDAQTYKAGIEIRYRKLVEGINEKLLSLLCRSWTLMLITLPATWLIYFKFLKLSSEYFEEKFVHCMQIVHIKKNCVAIFLCC